MRLSDLSIERPVLATVLSLLFAVVGGVSFFTLPVRELPDVDENRVVLLILLHDFHEAQLTDIPNPAKAFFPEGAVAEAESLIQKEQWGDDPEVHALLQEFHEGDSAEAKLAREAELCYVTLAMVTDYDCWHEEEEAVTVEALLGHLKANADSANRLAQALVEAIPSGRADCGCGSALSSALITQPAATPPATRTRLGLLVDRYLG